MLHCFFFQSGPTIICDLITSFPFQGSLDLSESLTKIMAQNHVIVWVVRNLRRSSSPIPLQTQGHRTVKTNHELDYQVWFTKNEQWTALLVFNFHLSLKSLLNYNFISLTKLISTNLRISNLQKSPMENVLIVPVYYSDLLWRS